MIFSQPTQRIVNMRFTFFSIGFLSSFFFRSFIFIIYCISPFIVIVAVGIDTRLTSCVAHDGSHESQQELLDSDGCSLDTSILPNVQERIVSRSNFVIKLLYANFQAFRFPDRDHLHLKCTVVVCKGKCLMVRVLITRKERG